MCVLFCGGFHERERIDVSFLFYAVQRIQICCTAKPYSWFLHDNNILKSIEIYKHSSLNADWDEIIILELYLLFSLSMEYCWAHT